MSSRIRITRRKAFLGPMVAAGALVVGVVGLAAPAQAAETCEAFGTIEMGKYYLNNNLWGQDSGQGTQCVRDTSQDGDTIGWSTDWSWTGGQNEVKSFVSSVLGWHWHPIDADTGLPVQLSSNTTVDSGWDFTASGSGAYNVAYDLWLTDTETPDSNTTPTDEIMIWLHTAGGAGPLGELVGTVEVAGSTWELYQGNIGWEVYSFVRTENTGSFQADLKEFLDYLVANRGLDASKYLASVQSGTEVFHGDGELDTTAYHTNVTQ